MSWPTGNIRVLDFVLTRPDGPRDFTEEGNALRREGAGWVTAYSDSHGLCFCDQHTDGGPDAWYDPDELTLQRGAIA